MFKNHEDDQISLKEKNRGQSTGRNRDYNLVPFIWYQIFYTNDINIIRVHYYGLKQKDSLSGNIEILSLWFYFLIW